MFFSSPFPKVTQFSCSYPNLAPTGCVQYFFGENPATVQSFNYDGGNGRHLANQDQQICIRQKKTRAALKKSNNTSFFFFIISGVSVTTAGSSNVS